jgi:hypothetical protein
MARVFVALLLLAICGLSGLWVSQQAAESAAPLPPDGSYTVEMNVINGEGHQPFIQMPEQIKLQFGSGVYIPADDTYSATVFGPDPWVTVAAHLEPGSYFRKSAEGRWEFFMSAYGTVAGYEEVRVTFQGHFEENGAITGAYTMGTEGELPGEYAIVYQAKNGSPPITDTPEPTSTPLDCPAGIAGDSCVGTPTATPGPQETVAQFLQLFNTAIQTGDDTFLLDRLNPHVIETYGEKNCAAAVAAMVDSTSSFTIKSISGPEPWTWNAPGVSILIDHVYTVSVQRVIEGESSMQDIHLAVVEDHLTWFRTCADTPLATPTLDVCAIAGGSSCTPTDTPTPQMVPPTWTPTNTPTPPVVPPTWTPTPRAGDGDCDNNGTSNALDALYVLQYSAGLIPNPGVCGDTNQDGIINAIDCSLILQYVAGFVQRLPWSQ